MVRAINGVDSGQSMEQRYAAASNDALFDSRAGRLQGVLDAALLLLELSLGSSADAQHGNATSQLGQALMQLLAVEVGVGVLHFGLDLVDAVLDGSLVAVAIDDGGGVLGDLDGLRVAKHGHVRVGERHAEVGGDNLTAGDDSDVFQHALAAIAEAGSLNGNAGEGATQLVQQDGSQSLALEILRNDEQRATRLGNFLEHRQQVLDGGNLLVSEQDERVFQNGFHALHVGSHIRGDVALVELHALDRLDVDAEGLGFLDGNDAFLADDFHGLGDLGANDLVARGNGADIGDLLFVLNRDGVSLDGLNDSLGGLLDAATNGQRIRASGDVAQTLGHDNVGEQGCGGGAVARAVVGLGCGFLHELGAHVLHGILELDFLGNRHAVVGDGGSAIGTLKSDVATLGAKGNLNGVGQLGDASSKAAAGLGLEFNVFSHCDCSFNG